MSSVADIRTVRSLALAGLAATWVALTLGYWLPGLGLPRVDVALWNGNLVAPDTASVPFAWTVGALQTLGLGSLLGIVYGRQARHRLPGADWVRGLIWGATVSVFSGMVLMPLLYGAGIFGARWDPVMPLSVVAWHAAWGMALGVFERI